MHGAMSQQAMQSPAQAPNAGVNPSQIVPHGGMPIASNMGQAHMQGGVPYSASHMQPQQHPMSGGSSQAGGPQPQHSRTSQMSRMYFIKFAMSCERWVC